MDEIGLLMSSEITSCLFIFAGIELVAPFFDIISHLSSSVCLYPERGKQSPLQLRK